MLADTPVDSDAAFLVLAVGERQDARMAVIVQFTVSPATQDQFNEVDARVGQAMMAAGGPPAGLMSHVVYPQGDGCVVADVWRTEAEGRAYVEDVLRPLFAEVGLSSHEVTAASAWSFARP